MLFLTKLWTGFMSGVTWCIVNWRFTVTVVAIFIVLVGSALVFNRCKKRPTIDIDKVNRINNANEKERKKELQDLVEQNQDVIKTVDERIEIQNVNVVERAREVDAKVAEANRKIIEAKSQGRDVTSAELECILVPENCL